MTAVSKVRGKGCHKIEEIMVPRALEARGSQLVNYKRQLDLAICGLLRWALGFNQLIR